jgi:Domain of unknown function (DUF1906)
MASITSRRSFLLKASAMATLAACSSSPKPSGPTPPVVTPPAPTPVSGAFPLITDTAQRLDVAKAKALYKHGARTVFRYYSHLPPSLPGKDLQPEEARIILGEGLSIGSVFQHYKNCFRTFENAWGREDAEQALRMAEAAGQPEGSAIYFGVDADWPYAALRDPILKYFEDVKQVFDRANIAVGIYSNGCICNAVREKGFAQYFWLSGSTGHSGTQAFYNTGNWTMFQNALDIKPAEVGFGVDTNIANPTTQGYFGQWDDRGARLTSHLAGDVQTTFLSRGFLRANTDIKAEADAASATLVNMRKDLNVRRLARSGDWERVVTQEGGAKTGSAAVTGWIPASALAPMDRFPDNTSNYGLCGAPTAVSDTTKYQNCDRATSRLR